MQGHEHEVAYLGPKASYTHQAALEYFDSTKCQFVPQITIDDVFASVQTGSSVYGVVPFENSTNGAVTFTLDLLADKRDKHPDVTVCGEIYIPVHHCLLGRKAPTHSTSTDRWESSRRLFPTAIADRTVADSHAHAHAHPLQQHHSSTTSSRAFQVTSPDSAGGVTPTLTSPFPAVSSSRPFTSLTHIQKLYSHPQAWGQCKTFMSTYLKGIDRIDTSSTSAAAAAVANDESGSSAAVCSALAAKIYGLDVLARQVEDSSGNTTRFLVIARRPATPAAASEERSGGGGASSSSSSSPSPALVRVPSALRASSGIGPPGVLGPPRTRRRSSVSCSQGTSSRPSSAAKTSTLDGARVPPSPPSQPSSGTSASASTATSASVSASGAGAGANASSSRFKSCIAFTVPNASTHPGALARVLSVFAEQDINLTSINTRPSGASPWHYIFFLEFDGRVGDAGPVDEALRRIDELVCPIADGNKKDGSVTGAVQSDRWRGGGRKYRHQDGSPVPRGGENLDAWWRVIGSWESKA